MGGAGDATAGDTGFASTAGRSSMRVGATSQLSSTLGPFGAWMPMTVDFPTRGGAGACCTLGGDTPFGATGGAAGEAGDAGDTGFTAGAVGGFGGEPGPRAPA
jgi:hypothetical protein